MCPRIVREKPQEGARRGFLPAPRWLPSDLLCSPTVPGRVSVIIPAHNAAATLPEALRSCFWQSRLPDEIVVVDDGSTDETPLVLQDLRRGRPELAVVHQRNLGAAAARNRAIRLASGEFIFFLDADDLMPPERITLGLRDFTHTHAALLYGQKERFARTWRQRVPDRPAVAPTPENIVGKTGCGTNTVATRRHLHIDRGVWLDETMAGAEDAELLVATMAAGAEVTCSPHTLCWRRESEGSLRHRVDWRKMRAWIRVKHRVWLEQYMGRRLGMTEEEERELWRERLAAGSTNACSADTAL